MPPFGQWPLLTLCTYATTFPIQKQDCPHTIRSRKHDGNRASSMTYMSGAAHFPSWKRQSPTARSHLNPDSGAITAQFRDVFSTIGSPESRPSPTHSPTFTRLSDLSFFKTQSTSIRSTTTISWMPSISRFRRHRTMPIALPVQWITEPFNSAPPVDCRCWS
jgi:hypothetical protein